jgi:hypothetical protein
MTDLMFSAVGFALGLAAGLALRELGQPTAARVPRPTPRVDGPGAARAPHRRRRRSPADRFDRYGRPILGLALIGVVVYAVVTQTEAAAQFRAFAVCQTANNASFQDGRAQLSASSKVTTQAALDNVRAQQAFLANVGGTGPGARAAFAGYQSALTAYADALTAQLIAQNANPLTTQDCGTP